ncbi:DUF3592 domain-containing protein [Kitasatospora sp. NBC_01560]|uniref:DUF3592 domain-containing protein n=1 Tax=Kitasatospora sp. NBC_01560 TaxID=2975965 RepID=UPI00386FD649
MTTERRLGGPRIFTVILLSAFALEGGALAAIAYERAYVTGACAPETVCTGDTVVFPLTAGLLLWLTAMFGALGLAEARNVERPHRLPLGLTSSAGLLLGLIGAYPGHDALHPGLAAPIALTALTALVAGVRGERRIRRENAEQRRIRALTARLDVHGVTVRGTITELHGAGRPRGGRSAVRLTVRYAAPGGPEFLLPHTQAFPVDAPPRVGDPMAVTLDPGDPATALAAVPGPQFS